MKDELNNVMTAMASLPQWPAFVAAFKERHDDWVKDTRDARVYTSHAEMVHVTARAAECAHWLETFESVSRKVHGPSNDAE